MSKYQPRFEPFFSDGLAYTINAFITFIATIILVISIFLPDDGLEPLLVSFILFYIGVGGNRYLRQLELQHLSDQ